MWGNRARDLARSPVPPAPGTGENGSPVPPAPGTGENGSPVLPAPGTGEPFSPAPGAGGTGGPETGRRLDRRPTGEILRHPGRRTGEDRRPGPETGRRLDRRPAGENLRRLHSLLKLAAAGLRTPSRNPPNPVSGCLLVLASGRFSPNAFFFKTLRLGSSARARLSPSPGGR